MKQLLLIVIVILLIFMFVQFTRQTQMDRMYPERTAPWWYRPFSLNRPVYGSGMGPQIHEHNRFGHY